MALSLPGVLDSPPAPRWHPIPRARLALDRAAPTRLRWIDRSVTRALSAAWMGRRGALALLRAAQQIDPAARPEGNPRIRPEVGLP